MLLVVAWTDAYRVPLAVLTPAGRKAVGRVRSSCLQELAVGPDVVAVRPTTCSQARLQKAMGHAVIAAARYYQTSTWASPILAAQVGYVVRLLVSCCAA
jgi:hypothetical protein